MTDLLIIGLFAWSVLGFLLLLNIVERYPADECSSLFKLVWFIVCGPLTWGIVIILFLWALGITIYRGVRKRWGR
jgi:hypothetical protein